MSAGPVDRCVCFGVTFAEILELHAEGLDLDEIAEQTGCTTDCGTCRPYVRLAIATGQTNLPVLDALTIEQLIAEAESGPTPD